jgi:hypothetical protein
MTKPMSPATTLLAVSANHNGHVRPVVFIFQRFRRANALSQIGARLRHQCPACRFYG